jgi:hypothetical protein
MRNFVRNIDPNIDVHIVLNCFTANHLSVLTSRPSTYRQAAHLALSINKSRAQLELWNKYKRIAKLSCILLPHFCSQRLFDQFCLGLLAKTTYVRPSLRNSYPERSTSLPDSQDRQLPRQ